MATVFGQIAKFDESKEEWPIYPERLEQYFSTNGVDDADRQRAILLIKRDWSSYVSNSTKFSGFVEA